MVHVRRAVACCGALAVSLVALSGSALAADPASNTTAANAVGWLKTQQLADGGFEHAFPGFETRDVALAVAEQAQTGSTWSTSEALAAVQAVKASVTGKTPLDFLEVDPAVVSSHGSAGKTILLTASPLGIDPAHFGTLDLVTALGGDCASATDSTFNGLLYVLLGEKLVCGAVPGSGLAAVRDAQQANGGWGFIGDPNGTDVDMDTTALAVEALVAGGADASDPAVNHALAFFAQNQQPSGAWQSFGSDDPNSTALVNIGITAAGFDPASSCWRDTVAPATAGTPYPSPEAWLRSQQLPDGRIASPNDGFGITTFATSQTVEGLLRSWLPAFRAPAQICGSPVPVVDTASPVAGGSITISGGGFAPSTALVIELHSDPVLLATLTSNPDGTYSATVVIPVDTPPGPHEVVVSGLGADRQPRTVSVPITVLAPLVPVAPTPPAVPTALVVPVLPVVVQPRFTG